METLYAKIGPERLRQLVDHFYDEVFYHSSISHLFDIANTQIRDKQYMFLTQFLGGPMLYTTHYGQPKMKMRHMPFKIDEAARNEWLRCMKLAIEKTGFDPGLGEALYQCFPQVASHMMNS